MQKNASTPKVLFSVNLIGFVIIYVRVSVMKFLLIFFASPREVGVDGGEVISWFSDISFIFKSIIKKGME